METRTQSSIANLTPSSFGRRFFASTLDGIFIQIANWITFFIFTKITGKNFLYFNFQSSEFWTDMLISMVISVAYVFIFWTLFDGATLGKKIFGIKIVKINGDKIDIITAVIRYFGYLISSIPLFLGYFWMIWDKEKRTWHDKIAGTMVVNTDSKPKVLLAILVFVLMTVFTTINMALGSIGYIKSDQFKKDVETFQKETEGTSGTLKEDQAKILTFAPTSCGVSIPILKTSDNIDGKNRKWVFEEVTLTPESFSIIDTDVYLRRNTMGAFVQYKEEGSRLVGQEGGKFDFRYPGFVIFCIDNTKFATIDEYKSFVLANKNIEITMAGEGKIEKMGEVEFVAIKIKEKQIDGQVIESNSFIGISKDNQKLFWLRRYNNPIDQNAGLLDQDLEVMWRNMQYRGVQRTNTIINETNTSVNSNSEVKVEINQ